MEQFTKSTAIGKDNKGQDLTTNTWALPYFGGKATQPMKTEAFQNKLETFTGSSQFNFHKKEIKPLFVPNKNVSFVNGTPVYNDEVKNRFNQSNYRNTELPFEQQRVGRGVGQNYGNKGVGGFHQYEIQELARPKSVDELRTISNPKVTYKQPIISGKSFNDKRGSTINISKNRPDKFTKIHQKDILKQLVLLIRTNTSNIHFKIYFSFKIKTSCWSAAPVSNIKPSKTPNFKKSKNNYKSIGVLNKTLTDGWNYSELSDYGKKGIKLPVNERDLTQKRTHVLNVIDLVKSITAPIQDKLKKTRKENVIGNPNPEGYISVNIPNKQTLYDPNDIARTTIKETTIHNKNHTSIKGHNKLTVYDPNDIARTTIKETTLFESNGGNIRPTRPKRHQIIIFNLLNQQ